MINAQFRIQLPEGLWVRELSEQYPETTFRLLSGYRLDGTAIELGEIVTDDPEDCIESLRTHPAIGDFNRLQTTDRRALSKYETSHTDLYDFVEQSAVPIEFPVVARNGWFEFDLTGTREELEQFQAVLDGADATFELRSLVSTTETDSLLTDRQRELLDLAVREGYYEIPRGCTLAELASRDDIDKATASTILRRGEANLIKWFLTGAETAGQR